jgi:16S rRNA G1207 methylase RsmC
MFSFRGSFSVDRVDDGINLLMHHSPSGYPGNVVDIFFIRGIVGTTDERRAFRT